ncbi:hypothetical protein [Chitinophaga sp.]|uniref:hypothetical protein n=1 Tax=Chitinophaga sp. TaxID=1869181 RepID=UPI002DB758B5|nr:hypothetical protein [Chitinophaga sp.]
MAAGQSQSLAELERQLDSLLRKEQKNNVLVSVGYGNNPAYGSKTANFERPIVMKPFISPSVAYYHRSGFFGSMSGYYLANAEKTPWFEWDLSAGYDYTKSRKFLAGISYTRYFFADSSDVPATPIKNELFAYFYYRGWWLQPGISLDFGWGRETATAVSFRQIGRLPIRIRNEVTSTETGRDFNMILALRHPFIFIDVLKFDDVLLITPSAGLILGTAHYYSNMKAFQYISRSAKIAHDIKHSKKNAAGQPLESEAHTGFEPRAADITLNASYIIGHFTLAPAYTVFKPLQGEDTSIMSYFTAKVSFEF